MRRLLATLAVGIAGGMIGALLVTAGPAVGSPGDPLVLSQVNQAGPMTVLKSNGGLRILAKNPKRPPLMVYTPDSMPPLQVSSKARVANLNADLLDGLNASAFVRDSHLLVAHAGGDQSTTVPIFLSTAVRTVSLTPPVAGTVVVSSTANVSTESAGGVVSCSIGLPGLPTSGYTQTWESPGSNGSNGQLAGTRAFSVDGGALFEASLVCTTGGASPIATIRDSALTAIFIPNP